MTGTPPAFAAETRIGARLRVTAGLTAAAVVLLALGSSLPLGEVIALPAFLVLLPGLAWTQLPLMEEEPLERIPVYLGSGATILLLGVSALALSTRFEGGVAAIGLSLLPAGAMLGWTLGVAAAAVGLILASLPLQRRFGGGSSRFLGLLLPRTRREKGTFAGLSLAAGVGEETAYRGYVFMALQLLGLGVAGAALVSSAAFGALHAYQGAVGIVRTAMVGLLFLAPVLATGSLLPAIAAHVLVDLVLGLLIGKRLLEWSGVPSEEEPRL